MTGAERRNKAYVLRVLRVRIIIMKTNGLFAQTPSTRAIVEGFPESCLIEEKSCKLANGIEKCYGLHSKYICWFTRRPQSRSDGHCGRSLVDGWLPGETRGMRHAPASARDDLPLHCKWQRLFPERISRLEDLPSPIISRLSATCLTP